MKRNNRSVKTSIRIREDIYEIAEQLCKQHGYSHADIYEMGVLLIDTNNEHELVIKEQLYSDMVERFKELHESIQDVGEKVVSEIKKLEFSKNKTSKQLKNIKADDMTVVKEAVYSVISMIDKRESLKKTTLSKLEPLGKDFFEMKSKEFGVPIEMILEGLKKEGYDEERLKGFDIFPEYRWSEPVVSKEQLYSKEVL